MKCSPEFISFLENKAYMLRFLSMKQTTSAGSGHPTSCMSAADIVAVLFFYAMHFDPQNPANPNNDRFILSKGHAAPLLYGVWSQLGIVKEHDLYSYRSFKSVFEGHPTRRFSRVEAATGSLGIGLSIGLGMALRAQRLQASYKTYVLLGDAEIAEGSVWEAVMLAAHYRTDNLIAIIDANHFGQSEAPLYAHHSNTLEQIFVAHGWQVFQVDGHAISALCAVMDCAAQVKGKPIAIIANTIKGYGIDGVEGKSGFHGKAFDAATMDSITSHMRNRFSAAAHYTGDYHWAPQLPGKYDVSTHHSVIDEKRDIPYSYGEIESTRKAFGKALADMGKHDSHIFVLDGDVKNSTYTEFFEQQFSTRFIQCFVAEQNMVSVGVGFDCLGSKVFISTFAAFFSRAHDQIRMAAIGKATIKLIGTHAGISIGQDGPSQMGLEDIAIMRGLPESLILYPADAISAYRLMDLTYHYDQGIAYLRATRMETPVIYDKDTQFEVGGLTVLKESTDDRVCVVAAGITVHEALKAYELLKNDGISIMVIDLYCIKPLNKERLAHYGLHSAGRMITVEDHYAAGGIGEAVSAALSDTPIEIEHCYVSAIPCSGAPEELLAWAGIDAKAIVERVKNIILDGEEFGD